MYAHLCHPEIESLEDGSKRILQYYPQAHQFHAGSSRLSPPTVASKTPFTMATPIFSTPQFYNGHPMGNLHEGYYFSHLN